MLNQINKAGITLLSNEDYLHIFHEIKNSITLINSSLQLVEKKHPEVREFDYWSESMSELCFLKNMVIQLSSAQAVQSTESDAGKHLFVYASDRHFHPCTILEELCL